MRRGLEECDDFNTVAGDGCSSACSVESEFVCGGSHEYWRCGGPGDRCQGGPGSLAACGSGSRSAGSYKECDDGNLHSGDGCSQNCQIECGFTCSGGGANATDVCAAAECGDGTLGGSEQCDDGNSVSGDGCGSDCRIERGYICMHYEPPYYPCGAYPSRCTPVSVSVSVSVAPWRCRYLLYWDSLRSLCPDCCAEGRLPLSSARALTRDIYHAALAGVSTAV